MQSSSPPPPAELSALLGGGAEAPATLVRRLKKVALTVAFAHGHHQHHDEIAEALRAHLPAIGSECDRAA